LVNRRGVIGGVGLLTPWIVAQGFRVGVREVAGGLHGREGSKTLEIAWTEVERFVYQQVAFYEFVVVERRDGTRARLYGAKRLMRWRQRGCTDDFAALLNQRLAEQVRAFDYVIALFLCATSDTPGWSRPRASGTLAPSLNRPIQRTWLTGADR